MRPRTSEPASIHGRVLRDLGALDWSNLPGAHRDVQALLSAIEDPRPLLQPARERDPQVAEHDRSAEKTTHFKWFLAADPQRRFELWVNDYKPATHRRSGHAETAHNHRFWFTSLILSGGFAHVAFEVGDDESLAERRVVRLHAGDTYVVAPDEVHTLREIEDGSMTLVVQSAPVRAYSDVYENGEVVRYHDLPSVRSAFNERLGALQPFAPGDRRRH